MINPLGTIKGLRELEYQVDSDRDSDRDWSQVNLY